MTVKTYDSRCYDLAEVFLSDEPDTPVRTKRCEELAALIQLTIEDWIAYGEAP